MTRDAPAPQAAKVWLMTEHPSFMLSHLLDGLREVLPEADLSDLAAYQERAAQTTSSKEAEWKRAFRCAQWSEEIVGLPAHRHLAADAERSLEAVRLVEGTAATALGQLVPSGLHVSNDFAVEITWVYEALRVAERAAATVGWSSVPWRRLLDDLISIGDEGSPPQ